MSARCPHLVPARYRILFLRVLINKSLRRKRYQSESARKKLDGKNCVSSPTAASYRNNRQNSLQNSDAFARFPRFFCIFNKLARVIRLDQINESSYKRISCLYNQWPLLLVLGTLWLVPRPLLLTVRPLWPALRPSVWAVDCSGILLNPMCHLQLVLRPLWLTLRPGQLTLGLYWLTLRPLWLLTCRAL